MNASPAPDAAAPPGMCPGVAAAGGGGGAGGGGAGGNGGKERNGGNGSGNGEGASGNEKDGGEGCGDPVCPVTGRVFVEILDFAFSAAMQLRWIRQYGSSLSHVDGELGLGWTHPYDWRLRERRRRVEVIDDGMRLQEFPLSREREPAPHPLGFVLQRIGDGFALTDRDGLRRTFGPVCADGYRHLVRVADRNGNTIEVERDDRGRLIGLRDAAGRPYRAHTDAAGRIERVAVATNAEATTWMDVARYTYDANGHLTSVTDAEGFVGRYVYAGNLLTEHHSPSGPTYVYRYDGGDSRARCIESWGQDGQAGMPAGVIREPAYVGHAKGIYWRRFTYDAPTRYSEVEDGLGGVQRFFGDTLGRVVKEVTTSGGVVTHHFRPDNGAIAGRTFEDLTSTAVQSTADGRPNGFQGDGGTSITTSRDEEGFEVSVYTNAKGDTAVVRRKFDERGNLRVIVHHDGSRESFDVDERGLVTRWFDVRGAVTQYFRDAMGNCVAVVRPGGKTERMEYDYLGRRIRHVDLAGRETTWVWDRRNEPTEKRAASGYVCRARYDGNRQPTFFEEAGRVTRYEYGGQAWPTRVIDPSGAATALGYDVEGNLRRVVNALGQTFSIELDHASRCIGWTTFEGVSYAATYDAADRLTSVRNASGRINLEYDPASRLASVESSDGTQLAFGYAGRGGPATVAGTAVPVERYLDAFGRMHGEKLGDHTLRVGWSTGDVAALEADVGLPLRYERDTTGRLAKVRVGDKERVVDVESGSDLLTSLGDHLVLRRRIGESGKVVYRGLGARAAGASDAEIALPGAPGTLQFVEYEYDAGANLTRERRSDGRTIEYELTIDGRVASRRVVRAGGVERDERLGYDASGTPRVAGARYDALGRPAALGNETFEYDALGRLVARMTDAGPWRYEWNALDQLVRVRTPDRVVEMEYDARGRRLKKRVHRQGELVAKTSYVWANNLVLYEIDELSGATRTYDRVNGSWDTFGHVDRVGDDQRATYYLLAPNGAVDLAVGEDGAVVWDADTTVFGHREPTRADVDVTARLPNQFHDPDVGLSYNWHRWYDARLGVFVTTDPLFLEGGLSPRAYAKNPLWQTDPTGWWPIPPGATPAQQAAQPGYHTPANNPNMPEVPGIPSHVPCPDSMLDRKKRAPASTQREINAAGKQYGCHSCGTTNSGVGGGSHWVADHQAPLTTYPGGAKPSDNLQLYPHCINCSRRQGGLMSHHGKTSGVGANP